MLQQRATPVKALPGNNKNIVDPLEKSLKPLWLISHYTGIIPDWFKDLNPNKSRFAIVAAWIIVSVYAFLLISGFGFEFYQLLLELGKPNATINSVMPNLFWFSNYPSGIVALIKFVTKRSELLFFFKTWDQLERQILFVPKCSAKRCYAVYGIYILVCIFGSISSAFLALNDLKASYLISFYSKVKEMLTIPGVLVYHAASWYTMWYLVILMDLAPAWTFYHASEILKSLAIEIEKYFLISPKGFISKVSGFQQIRIRYDTLSRLMKDANDMFGHLLVVGHGTMFLMICTELYMVVTTVGNHDWSCWIHLCLMLNYVVRLLVTFSLAGRMEESSNKLRLTVAEALNCEQMSPEDYKNSKLFLIRLRESPLVANPLDLYKIKPSLLLVIANLIISYVVILVQSK